MKLEIKSQKVINILKKNSFLLGENSGFYKEYQRVSKHFLMDRNIYLTSSYFSLGLSIESIVIPYFVKRENFKDLYKFLIRLFNVNSFVTSEIAQLSNLISGRNTISSIYHIGTVFSDKKYIKRYLRLWSVRSMPKEFESIHIDASNISENIASISFRIKFKKDFSEKVSYEYRKTTIDGTEINMLSNIEGNSEVVYPSESVVRRKNIQNLVDQMHIKFESLSDLLPDFFIRPDTYSLERRRINLFVVNNYTSEIFSETRSVRRSNLMRILGFSNFNAKLDKCYMQFASQGFREREDISYVILTNDKIYGEEMDDTLSAYKRIMVMIVYLESISMRLYRLESSINIKNPKSFLKARNLDAFEIINEANSFQEFQDRWKGFIIRHASALSDATISYGMENKKFDVENYIDAISKEAIKISGRMSSAMNLIKEVRDYQNIQYNSSLQRDIRILTVSSIIVGVLSLLSSEKVFSIGDLIRRMWQLLSP